MDGATSPFQRWEQGLFQLLSTLPAWSQKATNAIVLREPFTPGVRPGFWGHNSHRAAGCSASSWRDARRLWTLEFQVNHVLLRRSLRISSTTSCLFRLRSRFIAFRNTGFLRCSHLLLVISCPSTSTSEVQELWLTVLVKTNHRLSSVGRTTIREFGMSAGQKGALVRVKSRLVNTPISQDES